MLEESKEEFMASRAEVLKLKTDMRKSKMLINNRTLKRSEAE